MSRQSITQPQQQHKSETPLSVVTCNVPLFVLILTTQYLPRAIVEQMSADDIFKEFPQLETENLVLREMKPSDAEAIFQIYADNDVTKYIDLETATHLDQAKFIVNRRAELFRSGQRIRWGIARKDDDIIIGSCGFTQWSKNSYRAEIGYELAKVHWCRGIMTEALEAVIQFGFQTLKLNRIEALVMLENIASMKLLEKIGFREEGILREYGYWKGKFHDLKMFSILRRDKPQSPDVLGI